MKVLLCGLLLLSLFSSASSSCQGDCLTCREKLRPALDSFNLEKQLQKRFGGFTGARKSARKLASQKRFSEFMRQYLVLSLQSSQRRRTLPQTRRA
ncbi:PREDICTED: prepronociceptin [Condylura cristata]|uniref:prepronociceptin n=1 Tax=Condylura cristata TaxID=143302 RepID=UPI00033443EF|nr:PREDICTED: prepronociceptin [Condylura cristata]